MATKTAKAVARPKRPKEEVQQEFAVIRQEVNEARESGDVKAEELQKMKAAEIRQTVEGITVEGVVQEVSSLGVEISRALSELAAKMTQEVDRLATAREAVELERKELERLHKIDVASTALDQLVQDYAREKDRLEEEITFQREAWEEEKRQSERDRKEQEDTLRKQRQREVEDYEYKKSLERKKEQDKYEEGMKLLEKQNREKQETLEKSWQQREAALKEREDELARLSKEVETFPARLQKEAEQASARSVRAAEERFEQRILLLNKESEADKRLAEFQVKSLQEIIARQASEVTALQKQLDEAKQQVQEIAVKAIEGASGAKALGHINQIAMEQAKHRPPAG
ncbi:MAG: hypothetical protein ACRD2B_04250 [Terriglobia bacterium]